LKINNICNEFIKGTKNLNEYFIANKDILEAIYFVPKKSLILKINHF